MNRFIYSFFILFKNLKHHKIARCNICGKISLLMCYDISNARGDFFCIFCRSYSRKRHVAKILNQLVQTDYISEIPEKFDFTIYNTDVNDSFYQVLSGYDEYVASDLIPGINLGEEVKKGVFCQDLEELTFSSDSFDYIITEDVFEHVRNHEKGFEEIFRVLKKGGYHIFTVPCNFDRLTINHVDISGLDDKILISEYHGSKRGKVLVYRTFGIDIFELLDSIGFETYLDFSNYTDQKAGIFDSFVFVSKKI